MPPDRQGHWRLWSWMGTPFPASLGPWPMSTGHPAAAGLLLPRSTLDLLPLGPVHTVSMPPRPRPHAPTRLRLAPRLPAGPGPGWGQTPEPHLQTSGVREEEGGGNVNDLLESLPPGQLCTEINPPLWGRPPPRPVLPATAPVGGERPPGRSPQPTRKHTHAQHLHAHGHTHTTQARHAAHTQVHHTSLPHPRGHQFPVVLTVLPTCWYVDATPGPRAWGPPGLVSRHPSWRPNSRLVGSVSL